MIARFMMLCCTLIPLLCLAVAPERNTKFSTVELGNASIREMSSSGTVSILEDRFQIDESGQLVRIGDYGVSAPNPTAINTLYAAPCNNRDNRSMHLAIKPSALKYENGIISSGQQRNQPVLIVLAIPERSSGELVITYKPDDEHTVSSQPMAVPASATCQTMPR